MEWNMRTVWQKVVKINQACMLPCNLYMKKDKKILMFALQYVAAADIVSYRLSTRANYRPPFRARWREKLTESIRQFTEHWGQRSRIARTSGGSSRLHLKKVSLLETINLSVTLSLLVF